jgi:peptidoglycan biosynthesis protein MviN/MurJ (putative lipid II flippase)
MNDLQNAKSAVSAASVALIVFCVTTAAFLPPLNAHVLGNVALTVALALAIAASVILHLVFVAIAARKLGRSAGGWALLALVTLPLGSLIGIVWFEWALRTGANAAPRAEHGA